MLAKDAVSARLGRETGISYTEFSYQILQAYDFLELYRRHGCTLQIGGSDQWGNITAGTDLIRRVRADTCTPSPSADHQVDGTKFGKTGGGAVWLDPEMTSPYAFYQFWLNADDRDVVKFLKIYSFRSREEIEELEKAVRRAPAARAAQRALAQEFTSAAARRGGVRAVIAASAALFGQGIAGGPARTDPGEALAEVPRAEVPGLGASIVDLLAESGLVNSKSEARRAVEGGRCLPQQRQGHRRDVCALDGRPPARPLPGAAPGQAFRRRCRDRRGLMPSRG